MLGTAFQKQLYQIYRIFLDKKKSKGTCKNLWHKHTVCMDWSQYDSVSLLHHMGIVIDGENNRIKHILRL